MPACQGDGTTEPMPVHHGQDYEGPVNTSNPADSTGIWHNRFVAIGLIKLDPAKDTTVARIDQVIHSEMISYCNQVGWDYNVFTEAVDAAASYIDQNYDSRYLADLVTETKNLTGSSDLEDRYLDRLFSLVDNVESYQEARDSLDQIESDVLASNWTDSTSIQMMVAIVNHSFEMWLFAMDTTRTCKHVMKTEMLYFERISLEAAIADGVAAYKFDKETGYNDKQGAVNYGSRFSSMVWSRRFGAEYDATTNSMLDEWIGFL
jgi:hypothetical protein